MGYFSNKEIATVAEPSQTTLANSPNFVVFSNKKSASENDKYSSVSIEILDNSPILKEESVAKSYYCFEIKERITGKVHFFYGTYDKKKVSDNIFFIPFKFDLETGHLLTTNEIKPLLIENIKECLLKNAFVKNNFHISVETKIDEHKDIVSDCILHITARGLGSQYELELGNNGSSIKVKNSTYKPFYQYVFVLYQVASNEEIAERMSWVHIKIKDGDNLIYERSVRGTHDSSKVDNNTFLLSPDGTGGISLAIVEFAMKNLVALLRKDSRLLSYLDIQLDTVYCLAKLHNKEYNLEISGGNDQGGHLSIIKKDIFLASTDTIDYGTGQYKIALDVYTDHGQSRNIEEAELYLGNYVTTLSKSYFGRPLWFDLNTLLSKKVSYSPRFLSELDRPYAPTWCDAGTMTDYRFVAKRTDGVITESFFYSDPLYVINGYNYTLEPISLEEAKDGSAYIIDFDFYSLQEKSVKLRPLTTNFSRTHVKGQKQYFNFIYNYQSPQPSYICICYSLYTQMGTYIGGSVQQEYHENKLDQVNTTLLKLDDFLPMYDNKTIGRIDVSLSYKIEDDAYLPISIPISFRILPEVLNTVNDFAFLNQVGGWDTVNFGGDTSYEFKATPDTIYKTLQPDFTLQSEIESLSSQKVKEQKIAKTSPITKEDVLWLRQLSASPAVYELSTKRYVLIDDMSLKYNSSDDLYQVEMKYHYTDTFNTQVSK